MNDDNPTETIEAPAYLDDPKVLTYLKKVDADIDHMFLDEESGKLWPYRISNPKQEHRQCLEDLVALAFPAYFQAPPAMVGANEFLDRFKTSTAGFSSAQLEKFKSTPKRVPIVTLPDGQRRNPFKLVVSGAKLTELPLCRMGDHKERRLVGFARLPTAAYARLLESGANPDRSLWALDDQGHPCTRVKRSVTDWFYQRVADLMGELGIPGEVSVRLINGPA